MIRQDLSPVAHYAAARFPVADADLDAGRGKADLERQLGLWAEAQRKIVAADCAVLLLETLQVWARRADFDYGFDFRGAMSTGPLVMERSCFRA